LKINKEIKPLIKVDLTTNQAAAIESFVECRGITAFKNSNLLKAINRGDFDNVPTELAKWAVEQGRVKEELTKLRQKEIELFTKQP
jgi:lysozyme